MTAARDGLLLVDKPDGPTSHDIVARVRQALGGVRVGHAGTLDPAATGLLPLVLGAATRLARYLPSSPKCYEGVFVLGSATSTDDSAGEVRSTHAGPLPPAVDVAAAAERMLGRHDQVPPSVSARRLGGRRLYDLARRGVSVRPKATPVEVRRFDVFAVDEPGGLYRFRAEVSAGTYVRALARDLGASLGCGGHLRSLRRLRIGSLDVADAIAVDARAPLDAGDLVPRIIPLDEIPLALRSARLRTSEEASKFALGRPVPATEPLPEEAVAVVSPTGKLLGIAEFSAEQLHPRVVLAAPVSAGVPAERQLPGPRAL